MLFDHGTDYVIMRELGRPHRSSVGLPPTGRTLDVGEQR
jgi:hypothetical protein